MKHKLPFAIRLSSLILSLLLAFGAAAQPIISRLSPTAGPARSTVVINGSGFAPVATQNAVYFGTARATVTAATATQLTVLVPVGASSIAPVTVADLTRQQLGSSLNSATPFFTLTFPGPALSAASYQATSFPVATSRTGASALATADFNADAYPDFAVVADGGLNLLLSNGQGAYEEPVPLVVGTASTFVRVADVDANGTPDLLVGGYDLLLFRNLGNGNGFATAVTLLSGQRQPMLVTPSVEDLDADGRPDLITIIPDADPQSGLSQLIVLHNNGTGFDAPTLLLRERLSGQAVGDFNRDGRLDVVAIGPATYEEGASLLLLTRNAANTGFEAPKTTALGNHSVLSGRPLLADVNADGQPDVVVNGQTNDPAGYVYGIIVAQRTAAGFAAKGPYQPSATNGGVYSALQALADANGDGRPDILAASGPNFAVQPGQADGSFGPSVSFGPAGAALVTGDFDLDGRTDVATFDVFSGNLTIFLYTGASAGQNNAPTLNPLADLTLEEDAAQQSIFLSGISNGGDAGQAVTLTAVSSDPSLVPNPTISYFSPTSTGTLRLRPAPNAFGTCLITVTASDGQSQNSTSTRTFRVTVSPVNDAPTLDAIPDVIITTEMLGSVNLNIPLSGITSGAANETQILSLSSVIATNDPNNGGGGSTSGFTYTSPATSGTYQLNTNVNGGPPRLLVTVTVTLTDGQSANSSVTRTFRVYYNPGGTAPNQPAVPPTLDAIADVTASRTLSAPTPVALTGITDGDPNQALPLTVTASSSDPDLVSVGTLSYTSPATTGELPYTISSTRGGTAVVSVTVSNGQPQNGSLTRSFRVTVPAAVLTATQNQSGRFAFSLYPNPAPAGRFQLASSEAGPLNVRILDLTGRVVLARCLGSGQPQQLELPVATAAGVYVVQVSTAKGTTVRRLVVE